MQEGTTKHCGRQRPDGCQRNKDARLHGREAGDQLEALRGCQLQPGEGEHGKGRSQSARKEGRVAKQGKVQERVRQPGLPTREQERCDQADGCCGGGDCPGLPGMSGFLDGDHQRR